MSQGSIARTLRVLAVLCEHGPLTLSDLAERCDLTAPTALRFLRIMRDEGYAVQSDDRSWRATLLPWQLGCAVVDGGGWSSAVADVLDAAGERINESVVYAAYEDGATVYVAVSPSRGGYRTQVTLGARHPACDTTTGQCMLAHQSPTEVDRVMSREWGSRWAGKARKAFVERLTTIRADGFASGTGTLWQGLWGAAAPVVDRAGVAIGAVGTVMPAGRVPADQSPVVLVVRDAAARLSAR